MLLFIAGLAAILAPILMWRAEVERDAQEYERLCMQVETVPQDEAAVKAAVEGDTEDEAVMPPVIGRWLPDVPEQPVIETAAEPDSAALSSSGSGSKAVVDFAALKASNADIIAWLRIPGTTVDYPVVQSDDTEYYLNHTFTGKESSIGTLFSLENADYQTPGRNIAIYGHHLRSTTKMFSPLMSYKKKNFYENHKTVYLDSMYFSASYTVFAVANMTVGEWEPSEADFADDADFLAFVSRARSQALYDTGIDAGADDQILTLITCDRDFAGKDGRLVVMAVRQ